MEFVNNIFNISKGTKVSSYSDKPDGYSHRYLQIEDLRNNNQLKYTNDTKSVYVNENDIIIAWDGANVGTIGFRHNGVIGSTLARLSIKEDLRDKCNSIYIGYFLSSKFKYFQNTSTGAIIPHLSRSALERLPIPLPDIETQNKIVSILDKVKIILDKKEETIQKYDELIRVTFLEMFGDPIKNEKGFRKVSIEEVSHTIKDGPHVSPDYVDNGIPILSTRNIKPGQLVLNDLKFVSQEIYERLVKYFKPSKYDVIITKGGTTGCAKVIDWEFEFCIWVHLAVVRLKEEVNPYYFESFINSDYGYYQTQRYTQGIANRDLGLRKIAKIQLLLPPIDLQDRFALLYSKVSSIKLKLEKAKYAVEMLRDSLSQLAFKGQLNFNTAVDLEVLLENDYTFFRENSTSQSIQFLLDRLDKNELNNYKFHDREAYDKAKEFVFELLKEHKIKQVFDEKSKRVKLTI